MKLGIWVFVITGILVLALVILFWNNSEAGPNASPSPVDEAEIHIAYGRKKEARVILEKHLAQNPDDARARKLLDSARG